MDKKFLVIFNSASEKDTAMWWENQYKQNFEASVFKTFDDAKKFMRSEICDLFSDVDEDLLEHLFEGFCDESDEALEFWQLRNLVKSLLTQPNSFLLEIPEMQFTDDGDHYFAFVCNDKYVLVDNYDWCLKTNVHIMDKENKYYYFEVYNNAECIASFKLINTEKTIDDCTDDVEETFEESITQTYDNADELSGEAEKSTAEENLSSMIEAMKNKDSFTLGVIRMAKGAIQLGKGTNTQSGTMKVSLTTDGSTFTNYTL